MATESRKVAFRNRWNNTVGKITDIIPLKIWLIVPVEAFLLFMLVFPTLMTIYLSFTSWNPTLGTQWWNAQIIGFENYVQMLTSNPLNQGTFWYSVLLTLVIVTFAVGIEFFFGFGLALLVRSFDRLQKPLVLFFLIPMMIMPVVTGNIFFMLFRSAGPVNTIIGFIIGQPFSHQWLSTFPDALVPIILADVWHWYPLLFLIIYSGLNALPESEIQAAKTLGASSLQIFRMISIPYIKPVLLIGIVIRTMGAIKIFDSVFILTGGGPGNSTEVISLYLYKNTFEFFRIGFASAGAWIVFLIAVIAFSYTLAPLLYETEVYEDEGIITEE